MMNDTCTNVHVVNELNVPVLAMGLHDVVISASPEGILVSDKEQSSYIKPYVDKIDQQIMFAEKSWGSFRVLDVEDESLTIKVTLNPGHSMNYHSHMNRDEVWVVISGHRAAPWWTARSAPCMWAMWCRCRPAAAIPFWRTANCS